MGASLFFRAVEILPPRLAPPGVEGNPRRQAKLPGRLLFLTLLILISTSHQKCINQSESLSTMKNHPALLTTVFAGVMFLCAPALRADDTAAQAATPPSSYHASVLKLLGKDVIAVNSAKIATAADVIKTKKYLFVYKSAHWCPPCRVFTPKLVGFYNKYYEAMGDFDLVFVSWDHSQSDMNGYMKGEKMPWVGLKLHSKGATALEKKCHGNSIPCLMLLDENDNVIAESHSPDGKYLGPDTALNAYMKLHGKVPRGGTSRK